MIGLGIFAGVFAVYGLVAARAERGGLSRPFVFLVAGAVVALTGVVEPLSSGRPTALLLSLAEVALTLVLFADASRVSLAKLRRRAALPARLLGPAMVLSMGLGTVLGLWLFGELDGWECAALAAILVPTDAALGAAVVEDQRVPPRIRQALNVEAGLNDGLAVPFLLLFAAGATVTEGFEPGSFWATTLAEKVGIGLLAGVLVGGIAGELARRARAASWSSGASEQLAMAGVAIALFVFTEELGGSGFIAAFVGGLAAGSRLRVERAPALGFTDEEGAVVGAFVFFALGLFAVELFDQVTWQVVAYAVLSLTIVRMLPVAVALIGTGLRAPTVAFIGWFGPRGLASVVLALLVLEDDGQLPHIETLVLTTLTTVMLSIIVHGLSAAPLSGRYGAWAATLPPGSPELGPAPEVRTRRSAPQGRTPEPETPDAVVPRAADRP
jgi:NhaP-type Na+/H+ or K+/H+ antiporter